MPVKVKYQLRKDAVSPFVSAMFGLISAVLLGVIFWPLFVQYLSSGTYDGAPLSGLTALFYCILIGFTLLFSLFTAIAAKRSLAVVAFMALPVSLFYFLDVSGLRSTILFFDADNVFSYYRETAPVFRGWWVFVAVVAVSILLAAYSFIKIALNKARTKNVGVVINCINAVLWGVYGIIHVVGIELQHFNLDADFSSRDLFYAILYYLAGTFFFAAVAVLAASVRKTLIGSGGDTDVPLHEAGYTDAAAPVAGIPAQETVYAAVGEPVMDAAQEEDPPVVGAEPVEIMPGDDPHEPSAVVSIEQAEALANEEKPVKKPRGKRKKDTKPPAEQTTDEPS